MTLDGLADLHRHLDGSLRPETARELAARAHVPMPERLGFWRGMGLEAVWLPAGILLGYAAICFVLATWRFKFE